MLDTNKETLFFWLSIVIPGLASAILVLYFRDWWYILGALLAFLTIPFGFINTILLICCIVYWIIAGFDVRQYLTFCYFCSLWTLIMDGIAKGYMKRANTYESVLKYYHDHYPR